MTDKHETRHQTCSAAGHRGVAGVVATLLALAGLAAHAQPPAPLSPNQQTLVRQLQSEVVELRRQLAEQVIQNAALHDQLARAATPSLVASNTEIEVLQTQLAEQTRRNAAQQDEISRLRLALAEPGPDEAELMSARAEIQVLQATADQQAQQAEALRAELASTRTELAAARLASPAVPATPTAAQLQALAALRGGLRQAQEQAERDAETIAGLREQLDTLVVASADLPAPVTPVAEAAPAVAPLPMLPSAPPTTPVTVARAAPLPVLPPLPQAAPPSETKNRLAVAAPAQPDEPPAARATAIIEVAQREAEALKGARVYETPSEHSGQIGYLFFSTPVTVLAEARGAVDWVRIQVRSGATGWIAASKLKLPDAP